MTYLRREAKGMSEPLRFYGQPELESSSLIVGWSVDASNLVGKVIDYLNKKLEGQSFCEIEPVEFFPLAGVKIEDDLVQFPESKFYAHPKNNLVVFESVPPRYEWYKFFNLILDVAEQYCHVKNLFTIGGMVSLNAHTAPRELRGTFNSPEMKEDLRQYNLSGGLDYETPPGQRPTLNSFLLWTAKRRNIPGVSLWLPVPFYLLPVDDPKAKKKVLEFFNEIFNLGIDLGDLDEEISWQNQMIAEARRNFSDIDEPIRRLESNLRLSAEENQKLLKDIERFFRGKSTRPPAALS